jgi:hypothetical protein
VSLSNTLKRKNKSILLSDQLKHYADPSKSLVLCFDSCLFAYVFRIMRFFSRTHCVKMKLDRMYLTALQDGAQEEEASVQLSVSTTVPTIGQPE